jgi:hypothetical protein
MADKMDRSKATKMVLLRVAHLAFSRASSKVTYWVLQTVPLKAEKRECVKVHH